MGKVVIKLSIKNAQKRSKAFKEAAGIYGATSTSIDGDKIVVEGDGIDPITLMTVLRKKFGCVELISVTPVEEKKEEKKEEKSGGDKNAQPITVPYCCGARAGYPCRYAYEVVQYPDSCSIL